MREVRPVKRRRAAGLLSWIGCSPVPATDGNLIAIVAPGEYPQLLAEHCTRAPACRHCRAPLPHWQALIAAAGDDPAHYHAPCLDCGHTQTLAELRWHERAAFGRIGIAIFGVGEGLAVPGDELLHLLAAHTGGPWRHFYDRRYRPRSLT